MGIAKRLLGEEKVVEAPRTADTLGTESKRSLGRTQPSDQKPVEEKESEAFGDYYRRNFRTLGADCVLPELYPHFPIPRTSHEMPRKLAQSAPRADRQALVQERPSTTKRTWRRLVATIIGQLSTSVVSSCERHVTFDRLCLSESISKLTSDRTVGSCGRPCTRNSVYPTSMCRGSRRVRHP